MSEYVSTRGYPETIGFEEVIVGGYAPDQGLYVPSEGYPQISRDELLALQGRPYSEVFKHINSKFVGNSIPDDGQDRIIAEAYSPEKFPHAKDGDITPVLNVEEGISIQNLSLGPTGAFKDMALQPVSGQMNYVLSESGQIIVIAGASSGDTVTSAEEAAKGKPSLSMVWATPEEGMSAFQVAQIASLSGENIHNLRVNGGFDKCLELITKAHEHFDLGAMNSINWGRIAAQIPYYFYGYLQAVEKIGDPIDVSVPTGNDGNLYSAFAARSMGLPLRHIISANNENDTTSRFINTGVYAPGDRVITSSPSMDITRPKNLERLIYDVFEGDSSKVREFMSASQAGAVSLSDYVDMENLRELGFVGSTSTHANRLETIKYVHDLTGGEVVIGPHTADGYFAAKSNQKGDGVATLVMATELSVKFEDTVREAIGYVPEREERFKRIEKNQPADAFTSIKTADELIAYIEANTEARVKLRS